MSEGNYQIREEWEDCEDYDDSPGPCPDCEDGMVMMCIDDMCRGGGCIMEAGGQAPAPGCFRVCRTCKGTGES